MLYPGKDLNVEIVQSKFSATCELLTFVPFLNPGGMPHPHFVSPQQKLLHKVSEPRHCIE